MQVFQVSWQAVTEGVLAEVIGASIVAMAPAAAIWLRRQIRRAQDPREALRDSAQDSEAANERSRWSEE